MCVRIMNMRLLQYQSSRGSVRDRLHVCQTNLTDFSLDLSKLSKDERTVSAAHSLCQIGGWVTFTGITPGSVIVEDIIMWK